MEFITYLYTKMKNTTLKTFMTCLVIVATGTFGLSLLVSAESNDNLRALSKEKAPLLEQLEELRESKIQTFNEVRSLSGSLAIALKKDKDVQAQIEAVRAQIERIDRLIMAETGEDFTKTFE